VKKLLTAAVLLLLGAAGLFNGIALVSDPSGATLGISVDMLPEWHTWDYRYSGMFVLVALGLAPMVCAAAVIVDVSGSRLVAGIIGAIAIGWAAWQIVVLDVNAPQAQIALVVVGVLLVLGAAEYKIRARARSH
jgi:hypothetical protein